MHLPGVMRDSARLSALAWGFVCAGACAQKEAAPPAATPDAASDGAMNVVSATPDGDGATGADAAPAPASRVFAYVKGGWDRITVLTFDTETGFIAKAGEFAGIKVNYLALSPDRRHLYAARYELIAPNFPESERGWVTSFAIDQATGALARMPNGDGRTNGTGPVFASAHPSGRWVLVPHFWSHDVAILPVDQDGAAGHATTANVAACEQAHSLFTTRDGRFAFVPCREGDRVAQFVFDDKTGALMPNDPPEVVAPDGSGMRMLAFHPSERWAYVVEEQAGKLATYDLDRDRGVLSNPTLIDTARAGVTETASGDVRVHPGGRFLYVTSRADRTIGLFALDETTGRPTLVAHTEVSSGVPHFALSPDARFLLVPGVNSTTVHVFAIDQTTGRLTPVVQPGKPTSIGRPDHVLLVDLAARP